MTLGPTNGSPVSPPKAASDVRISIGYAVAARARALRRYPAKPNPAKPSRSIAQVEGSGTAARSPFSAHRGLHRGGRMNVVPVHEAIDVPGVASRVARRARRQAGEGVAGVGGVREPVSGGVGQNIRVEAEKVEVRERCARGQLEGLQLRGEVRVVQLAKCRGFRKPARSPDFPARIPG